MASAGEPAALLRKLRLCPRAPLRLAASPYTSQFAAHARLGAELDPAVNLRPSASTPILTPGGKHRPSTREQLAPLSDSRGARRMRALQEQFELPAVGEASRRRLVESLTQHREQRTRWRHRPDHGAALRRRAAALDGPPMKSALNACELSLAEAASVQLGPSVGPSGRLARSCVETLRRLAELLPAENYRPILAKLADELEPCLFSDEHHDDGGAPLAHLEVWGAVHAHRVREVEAGAELARWEAQRATDALGLATERAERAEAEYASEAEERRALQAALTAAEAALKAQQAEARELTALNGRLVNDAEAAVEGRIVSLSNEVRTLNDELERRRAAEDALEAQLEVSVPEHTLAAARREAEAAAAARDSLQIECEPSGARSRRSKPPCSGRCGEAPPSPSSRSCAPSPPTPRRAAAERAAAARGGATGGGGRGGGAARRGAPAKVDAARAPAPRAATAVATASRRRDRAARRWRQRRPPRRCERRAAARGVVIGAG